MPFPAASRTGRRLLAAVSACAAFLAWCGAAAQAWPARPVRVLVGFPPGAGVDIAARLVTPRLAETFGQPFIVDNRPGAAGNIAAEIAARTPPDGYTLLSASAPIAVSQSLYRSLGYSLERDLEPIVLMGSAPLLLVVHPSVPVNTMKDFVAFARSRPGDFAFASTGSGSTPHLAMEMFASQAGIRMVHVPYKGTPQAVADIMSGQIQVMFANTLSVVAIVKSGRLRALALSGAKRSAAAPGGTTVAECGLPGFEASTWYGFFAPAGTPREIVQRFNAEVVRLVGTAEMQARLLDQGADPATGPPEQFRAFVKSEVEKWGKVVRTVGIRQE